MPQGSSSKMSRFSPRTLFELCFFQAQDSIFFLAAIKASSTGRLSPAAVPKGTFLPAYGNATTLAQVLNKSPICKNHSHPQWLCPPGSG